MTDLLEFLAPTPLINSDSPAVIDYANSLLRDSASDDVSRAIALYEGVRDDIKYTPYVAYHREDAYRASDILQAKRGHCVGKASLLCAAARTIGIPSRVGFATVKNHLSTVQLTKAMGSGEFAYHGYSELFLNERWVIATPAFDTATCGRHKVSPLIFDGITDSKYQQFNQDQQAALEYLEYHGSFSEIPIKTIITEFRKKYGDELVDNWIDAFDQLKSFAKRRFDKEEALKN